jgi:acyl-CoA synthetase (NDP forming)
MLSRRVYRPADLARLLDPKSVAVVGASASGRGFGAQTLLNLASFTGRVYAIHPQAQQIGEVKCYPSIAALPEVPDCVVIGVPREGVEAVVRDCAAAGVGGAVLYSSGFAETGQPECIALQQRIVDIARDAGMRLLGPNCIGFSLMASKALVTFFGSLGPTQADAATIGLISQSGALGNALFQASECGIPFSHRFTTGNSCDVDVADLVAYLAEAPDCNAIACLFEGVADPHRMMEAAQIAWAADKPLIIYKIASGEIGAQAAMSHTGSLSGSDAAYRAAFARTGAVVVDDFEALLETTRFFAKMQRPGLKRPPASGVAVIAGSGGASVIAADKAELHGVPLPQPSPEVYTALKACIPEFGSARNPCDVTAQATNDPKMLASAIDILIGDPVYGAMVLPQVYASAAMEERLRVLGERARHHGKAACVVWLTQWGEGPGALALEQNPDVALFRSTTRCFAALAAWQQREARRAQAPRPVEAQRLSPAAAAGEARALVAATPGKVLTERESKAVLALYGIPVVGEGLAADADEAARIAARVGYPVVLKAESPDLPHKTEAGVIRLGIADEAALRRAHADILANAGRVQPPPRLNGVLVQPMVPAGLEIMIGGRIDPLFGPLLVLGLGGVMVELLRDTQLAPAPVTPAEVRDMLGQLKGAALLQGFRGSEPVDLDVLAGIACRVGEMLTDLRDLVVEVDINPVICAGSRQLVVDALIVKSV